MEIGSEFWDIPTMKVTNPIWNEWNGDKRFLVSGRTALDVILQDILLVKNCSTAYLPSYCCETMIEPFVYNGLKVRFYSVEFKEGSLVIDYDADNSCDIVYLMHYFGFELGQLEKVAASIKNATIIQDVTHSLFQEKPFLKEADYVYASFRKWVAVPGAAIAMKSTGVFSYPQSKDINNTYVEMRQRAIALKASYINNGNIEKGLFLSLFNQAELLLEKDYRGYGVDNDSILAVKGIDSQDVRKARRYNAEIILSRLNNVSMIEPVFNTLEKGDCPLFVPVRVKNGQRDALRKYLIQNRVFCPVHWPLSHYHLIADNDKKIYDQELSLICDQRYDKKDLVKQIELIERFERENGRYIF